LSVQGHLRSKQEKEKVYI